MGHRKIAAAVVLGVWAVALGWHVKREYFPPEGERLRAAARTLPPGPSYYRLMYGDVHIGWARSQVDTVGSGGGFQVTNRLEMRTEALGFPGEFRTTTEARLSPSLALESFLASGRGPIFDGRLQGEVQGDSLIVGRFQEGEARDSFRVAVDGPVVMTSSLPLRLAAEPEMRSGRTFQVPLFDPRSLSNRTVRITVAEGAVRSYPDSADRESPQGPWRPARWDSVRAWKVEHDVAGLPLSLWIDEDGRVLEATLGERFRLERTAFELAFYGWEEE